MAMLTSASPRAAYFYERPDTSTFRYRVFNVTRSLNETGRASAAWFEASEMDGMDRVLDLCDVLVLCRTRYTERVARLVEHAHARGRRVLFDCDDLVFDLRHAHLLMDTLGLDMQPEAVWDQWFAYVGRMAAAFQLCDGAIVTNPTIAAYAAKAFGDGRPVAVAPNYLEPVQQAMSERIWDAKDATGWARDGRVHLGYFSGSPTHNRDFALVAGPIARLMDEDPRLHLNVVGFLQLPTNLDRHAARVTAAPLTDYLNLQRLIGAVEVNMAPLQDNPITNCKSALKWFEAAVVGALTVATPTQPYRASIRHGETGWLAPSHAWESTLRSVLAGIDADGHEAIRGQARAAALAAHGWRNQASVIETALFGPGR